MQSIEPQYRGTSTLPADEVDSDTRRQRDGGSAEQDDFLLSYDINQS